MALTKVKGSGLATGAATESLVGIDDNATSTAITINSSDNVGIGTSSPNRDLTVNGTAGTLADFTSTVTTGAGISLSDANTSSNYVRLRAIGNDMQLYAGNSERMRITSAGNVGIGTTSPTTKLHVSVSASGSYAAYIENTTGSNANGLLVKTPNRAGTSSLYGIALQNSTSTVFTVRTNGAAYAASWNTTSDYRAKENVVPMTGSIDRLKLLKPSSFNFKDTELMPYGKDTVDGFLAHEAGEVVPECATGTKDAMRDEEYEVTPAVMDGETVVTEAVMGTRSVPDYQGIDQSKLVPLLVASLQEAVAKIEALEARVTALEV
jgi:hypothetical protein